MMATRPGAASPSPKPPTPSPSPSPSPAHDAEVMCRYPSKKCWNPRALKRNGERHNLCDLHRQKANKNQRRLELKRKTRAQASADHEPAGKRLRKKTRQRARRAPLSAHLAMKEEARARQQAEQASSASSGPTGWFLQDLGLLDGGHFDGFQAKDAQLLELQRLPDAVDEEVLDRILQDGQGDASKCLDATGLEALAALPEGKTSPVDVGETWDNLDFSDYWLAPTSSDQPAPSFDASAFVVDEDVFVADV
ncbi:hypothetical protein PRIC2_008540 [Phytophthora ramorum]